MKCNKIKINNKQNLDYTLLCACVHLRLNRTYRRHRCGSKWPLTVSTAIGVTIAASWKPFFFLSCSGDFDEEDIYLYHYFVVLCLWTVYRILLVITMWTTRDGNMRHIDAGRNWSYYTIYTLIIYILFYSATIK